MAEESLIEDPSVRFPRERSVEMHEARVRGRLAFWALALIGLTFLGVVYLAAVGHWADAKEMLGFFLPAETAFLGTAGGFYFGAKK
jgi:hypothetical protein